MFDRLGKLIDLAKRITEWLDNRGLELSQDALVDSMRNLPVSRLMTATADVAASSLDGDSVCERVTDAGWTSEACWRRVDGWARR